LSIALPVTPLVIAVVTLLVDPTYPRPVGVAIVVAVVVVVASIVVAVVVVVVVSPAAVVTSADMVRKKKGGEGLSEGAHALVIPYPSSS